METRTEKLKRILLQLKEDHFKRADLGHSNDLMEQSYLSTAWQEVDGIVNVLGEISQKEERKFQELIEGFETELDSFDKGLEKYTMIREFAPEIMAEMISCTLKGKKSVTSATPVNRGIMASEVVRYAEALAEEVMKKNPDRKYLEWPEQIDTEKLAES